MNDLSLLPADPVRFFGLDSGYDRRDLKRAYGKSIRMFRPDTHPAEFGLVRSAYEQLEQSLRYGQQQRTNQLAADLWRNSAASDSLATSSPHVTDSCDTGPPETGPPPIKSGPAKLEPASDSKPPGEPAIRFPNPAISERSLTIAELAIVDPPAALRMLESKTRRTPPDYYLAAVLSDAASPGIDLSATDLTATAPTGRTSDYLHHLLGGLQAFPADPGLTALVAAWVEGEVPDSNLANTILNIARTLRTPQFYRLTEKLWLRLIEINSFRIFSDLLDACDKLILGTDERARIEFDVRILRSAIWIAPPRWSKKRLRLLESQSAAMSPVQQMELDFLGSLLTVVQHPANRRDCHPVRHQLLTAIRLACGTGDLEQVATMHRINTELANDPATLISVFPMTAKNIAADWQIVLGTLHSKWRDNEAQTDDHRVLLHRQMITLSNDLQPTLKAVTANAHLTHAWLKITPFVFVVVFIMLVGSPLLMVSSIGQPKWVEGLMVNLAIFGLPTLSIVLYRAWLYPRFIRPLIRRRVERNRYIGYVKHWRRRLFRHVQSSHQTIDEIVHGVARTKATTSQQLLAHHLNAYLRNDEGIVVYSMLRQSLD